MEDKICLSICLCVSSTSVFLLALCRFHIEEEGNKKQKKVFHYESHNPSETSSVDRVSLLHAPRGSFRLVAGEPLHQTSQNQRVVSWSRPERAGGSSSGPVVLQMCFSVCLRLGQSDKEHINGGPI